MRVVRYPGGKAGWVGRLLPLIPDLPTFVDCFGGGGSVLLSRFAAPGVDVYNDLDLAMSTLMRVLGDPDLFARFHRKVFATPYSRVEQNRAVDIIQALRDATFPHSLTDVQQVEVAWAIYVQMNQSVAGAIKRTKGQWPKDRRSRIYTTQWWGMVDMLPDIHNRLRLVQVERRPALEVIDYFDSPQAALYLDPPYVHDTRTDTHNMYTHEMTNDAHEALVDRILEAESAVTVSGYDHPIYQRLESEGGWTRHTFDVVAPMTHFAHLEAAKREEVVWTNPYCSSLITTQPSLLAAL